MGRDKDNIFLSFVFPLSLATFTTTIFPSPLTMSSCIALSSKQMELLDVLQCLIVEYLCPLETPDAILFLQTSYFDLQAWTVQRQVVTTNPDGRKETKVSNILHCVDGPAIKRANGAKEYYRSGRLHRLDGPAIEDANGGKGYYQNGFLHRMDGPAIEYASGLKYYYQNGVLHRQDGPAIECANGPKKYYQNGVLQTPLQIR